MPSPTPEEVRSALADFDPRRQKVVVGLFAALAREPARVRDREWVARQLAEVTVLAGDFDADTPADGVRAVEAFLHESSDELLRAGLLLFQRVGLDLAPRAAEGFGLEDAMRQALGYLPPATGPDAG